MSTAQVAAQALELSNIRQTLNLAVTDATRTVFLGITPHPATVVKALHDLCEKVDDVIDRLEPFAFYTDVDTERLLGLSRAIAYARAGDVVQAGELLVALYDVKQEAA